MSKVTEREFKRSIKDADFKKLYFLYGEDKYTIKDAEEILIKKTLGLNFNNFNYIEIDGQNLDISKLEISLETYPVNSDKKCILIKNLDMDLLNTEDIEKFYNIISDIPKYCLLIISEITIKIDNKCSLKWKKTINLFETAGMVVKLDNKNILSVEKQLIKWANERGKNLSSKNAGIICNICGGDLFRLHNEIQKLCAFEEYSDISEESIKLLVNNDFTANVFEMCKMLSKGKYKETLEILNLLFFQREEPITILSVVSGIYIDIYRVKVVSEAGIQSSYITEMFDYKKKEFKIGIAEKNSANISVNNLKKIIEVLIYTDLKLKSSKINPKLLIEVAIVKIIMLQNNR